MIGVLLVIVLSSVDFFVLLELIMVKNWCFGIFSDMLCNV